MLAALSLFVAFVPIARAEEPLTPEEEQTLEVCRQNRRCRLELLRNDMIAQRRQEARKLQQAAEMDQRHAEQLKREGLPVRRVRKLETDGFVSTTSRVGQGILLGWGITEHWRAELIGTFVKPNDSMVSNYFLTSGYAAMGRAKWIPFESQFAPYIALGMSFQKYNYDSSGYFPPIVPVDGGDVIEEPPSSEPGKKEAYAHLVVPAIGVDLQLRFGLHLGIELQYPIPIYTLFRDSNSHEASDTNATELMNDLKKKLAVGFIFGWAWDIL